MNLVLFTLIFRWMSQQYFERLDQPYNWCHHYYGPSVCILYFVINGSKYLFTDFINVEFIMLVFSINSTLVKTCTFLFLVFLVVIVVVIVFFYCFQYIIIASSSNKMISLVNLLSFYYFHSNRQCIVYKNN